MVTIFSFHHMVFIRVLYSWWFCGGGGGTGENPSEQIPRSKARTNSKLNPSMTPGGIEPGHIGGDERSHHCAISAPYPCRSIWVTRTLSLTSLFTANIKLSIFREEARSVVAGFHAGPLSCSNWNLEMVVFCGGGKPENPEKFPRSKARTNSKLNPPMTPGGIEPGHIGGDERSHHCAIPAPYPCKVYDFCYFVT